MEDDNFADDSTVELKDIKPIVPSELYKIIKEETMTLLTKIANEYDINLDELVSKYQDDISKISVKLGIKKRNRRVLPPELQCMGRKCGGGQCTRSKKPGHDYCLSHIKNLKYGNILDNSVEIKTKGKRGRKPIKNNYPPEDYIAVSLEVIDSKQYFVDYKNNVYSYCKEAPEFIGKKNMDGELVLAKHLTA
tara:strand:+ start:702 stop:1277 length:576 start_codon:yes stop_codon:yes gene_type:complete